MAEEMRGLVVAGTLLPVLGVVLTAGLAALTRTRPALRQAILLAVPGLTALACWWAVPFVWRDGNLLAAVLYLAYWSGLVLYYPLLAIGLVFRHRRRQAADRAGAGV